MSVFSSVKARKDEQRRADIQRSLLHQGARIGGEVFGPIPKGHRREFFCLDRHTWIWHEEWDDARTKQHYAVTTRYDVRPNGILKSQGTNSYQKLSEQETENLYRAAKLYYERFSEELNRIIAEG
jgi:hypothetical protein